MKFTIHKSDFRNVLSKVQGLAGRKSNLAITENVLIQAQEDGIHIFATDLETGMEGRYPADVASEGMIAINAKKLHEIVRDFPSDQIVLDEEEDRWIRIGNENIEYHIVGMNPDDFPEHPELDEVAFFETDTAGVRRMIERTVVIGVPPEEKRQHILGVYFEKVETESAAVLRMVSTDGSRLALADAPLDAGDAMPAKGVLVPKKGLQEALKFLDTEGPLQLGMNDNHLVLRKNEETLAIRMIDGDFPQYQEIIRKNAGTDIEMDRRMFLMMLRRMSILSSENYKGVIFNFEPNRLRVTATNPDIGESKEDMRIDYEGEPIEAAFNPKFFIESLNVIEDETVVLHMVDKEKPCIVTGGDDPSYLSVIMPMRI